MDGWSVVWWLWRKRPLYRERRERQRCLWQPEGSVPWLVFVLATWVVGKVFPCGACAGLEVKSRRESLIDSFHI